MKVLIYGLNFSPEEIGIGKFSGEMAHFLSENGFDIEVVTTPPYYPQWKIFAGFAGWKYVTERGGGFEVHRCPLWVPKKVSGLKRIVHLLSFAISSFPVLVWHALAKRPDLIWTVEPAAFCMPGTLLAAKLCGAKSWLHIQDFEVDAAFELGILKAPFVKRLVLAMEAFLMRRFDRVSSISINMVAKAESKGVEKKGLTLFPNWVDCTDLHPLNNGAELKARFGLPENKIVAMYSGNVGAKQGLELVIEAARLSQDRPELHYVICGNGAAYPEIERASRGIPNLQLLPVQPSDRFNELMNAADIHLLPQRSDAADLVMPSKLGGMMATGKAIVACAAEGTQIEKVVTGRGLVVQPGCSQSLFTAVLQFANNLQLRQEMGVRAREYAVEFMGKDAILARFASELRSLGPPG